MWWIWLVRVLGAATGIVFVSMIRYAIHRPYEARIGWRYLYGGKRDRLMLACAGGSALLMVAGIVILLTSHGGSPLGVLTLVVGMISTAVFGLLSLFTV